MEKTEPARMRRIVTTALAGASIEWYDFFIYGTAAAMVSPNAPTWPWLRVHLW